MFKVEELKSWAWYTSYLINSLINWVDHVLVPIGLVQKKHEIIYYLLFTNILST